MEEHGIDFIEFLQMEAEDKFEYELTFKVTVHDTKEQRFVFMKGNFLDMFTLTSKLLTDDIFSTYETSERAYKLISVSLIEKGILGKQIKKCLPSYEELIKEK
ncbi:hypothetical protein [Staphylococcus phage vB_SauM-V1SA22]|nr:hypothetical protein [Staphylococcus phage vB_SauM-V1SA22]